MRRILPSVCFIFSLAADAQIASNKNIEVFPQRGIYLSYDEFVNNCPSIVTDFESTLIYRDIDTTVIGAQFNLLDSSRFLPPIWGFCDGQYAFIALYTKHATNFWKLSFIGKNPYFLMSFKSQMSAPLWPLPFLIVGIFSHTVSYEAYELMMLNKNGDVELASYPHLKRLFASNPTLLKNFKSEKNISDKLKKQYLKKFNLECTKQSY